MTCSFFYKEFTRWTKKVNFIFWIISWFTFC